MAFTAQQIKDYVESVKFDPVAIAQTAGKFNVSMDDIASAMGYDTEQVLNYLKDGLQNAGMSVYFEGGEQQGEASSTYTPITISSFSKPVDGSKQKYEAFGADMQSRGIIDNGSLGSQIFRDLSPIITMAVPFAGAELASLLGVSTATGTALVNAGMQVAQGGDATSVLKGLVSSQLSQAISPVVASELQDIISDPTTSKLITNIGTSVVNSALTGNTNNLGKTIVGSAVDTLVGTQTGNSTLGNVLGSAVTGGGQGAANTLAGIVALTGSNESNQLTPTIDTYPETDDDLTSILAGKSSNSSITAPTDTQSLLNILGDSGNQIINDAPFVAQPTTQTTQATQTTPDYSGQSFGSAFSAARSNGDTVFNWNGKPYNTNLAPPDTGTTTQVSTAPTTQTNITKTAAPPVSDVYPDIKGTAADKAKTTQTTAENLGPYIGYKNAFGMTPQMGDINQVADPRTLALAKGFIGDYTSDKGFSALHPDIEGIKNAGDVGTYSGVGAQLAPLVGPISKLLGSSFKTLGSAAAADEGLVSLLGKNTYKAPDNVAPFPRLTADDRQMSLLIQDMLGQPKTNQTAGQAWDQLTSGSPLQAYQTLNANPATRSSMLNYAGSRGYSEVSPFAVSERTNMFQPAQYVKNIEGTIVPNQTYLQAPKGPMIKANGGLISSNNMDELLKIING